MMWILFALAPVLAILAFLEGRRRGRMTDPHVARLTGRIAELESACADYAAQIAEYNLEAERRETAAYERGRLDQAEVEAAQRSSAALRAAATRRDRRTAARVVDAPRLTLKEPEAPVHD